MKKYIVTILGAGNMGTALAKIIGDNGHSVKIWNYEGDQEALEQITEFHENKKYLPGIQLSDKVVAEKDLAMALQGAQIIFFAVPSNAMESVIKNVAQFLPCGIVCVDASKGLDEKDLGLITNLIAAHLPTCLHGSVASISGPAVAGDMARGGFTAMNVASKEKKSCKLVKAVLENEHLRLIETKDVVGVEVAGSFKNVYAIAMGLCDGLHIEMNTKAALLVIALKEIGKLVKKMGGKSETVYDLAGLGDLVGTGLCASSRNRRFGEYLASGLNRQDATTKVEQVVEGINASKMLKELGEKYKLKMPFAEMVYSVVWNSDDPATALKNFLRSLK